MTFIAKPKVAHPSLPRNELGLTTRDYEGAVSTLCAGCGHDSVTAALIQAVFELDIEPHMLAKMSGIGCSSRISGYMDFHTLHTIHGRALAFATGVKLSKPELNVIVPMGDGDALSIGGNHFIHAARRNIDELTRWVDKRQGWRGPVAHLTAEADKRAFRAASRARYGTGTLAMFVSSFSMALLALLVMLQPTPWYTPQYAIPLLGMLLGNTMSGIAVALDNLTSQALDKRGQIEARLALGHSAAEAVGANVRLLMPAPYCDEHDDYLARYHRTGERHVIGQRRELRGLRKNGAEFPLEVTVTEVVDFGLFVGIARDLSDRRRLEKEVARASTFEQERIGQEIHDGLGHHQDGSVQSRLLRGRSRELDLHVCPERCPGVPDAVVRWEPVGSGRSHRHLLG